MHYKKSVFTALLAALLGCAQAATIFVEAESFNVAGDGWQTNRVRTASGVLALDGSRGSGTAKARREVEVVTEGTYRVWVRYLETRWRGPFNVRLFQGGEELASATFDLEPREEIENWQCGWSVLGDVPLAAGFAEIVLEKYRDRNCTSYTRQVDCILLTDDLELVPRHTDYGPQTWLRTTLGDNYPDPVYLHIFADHYRAPWYGHYAIAKDGRLVKALRPAKGQEYLKSGDTTGWVNITPLLYQDSGAILSLSLRQTYYGLATNLTATFEFAAEPNGTATVKRVVCDNHMAYNGGGVTLKVIVPPDLLSEKHRSWIVTDRELAEAIGKQADAFEWPAFGKKPEIFPFLVSAGHMRGGAERQVVERESRTLANFGFNNERHQMIGGAWYNRDGCYSQPDLDRMEQRLAGTVAEFRKAGHRVEDIAFAMLTDEPSAQPLEHIANCPACTAAFQEWLPGQVASPGLLGAATWEELRPVEITNNAALYYFSQRFRPHALGTFMAHQRRAIAGAYGRDIPACPNFSDSATYGANFYGGGVDYFELLESGRLNAIWSENWGNGAASPQCTTFNVELMRSAAMAGGETVGHHLIAYARRRPWDIKLMAVSQAARDVKVFKSFHYGPAWAGHEGGAPWRTTAWIAKPGVWRANAELTREFGAAEELLHSARKVPSQVAILYSASSDIWTVSHNRAYGFDRMFIWLALAHAQIPVDFISENKVADGGLASYRLCYLAGPNLTRAAAAALAEWVADGGTLVATAGAAQRDEFNHPMPTIQDILPAAGGHETTIRAQMGSGATVLRQEADTGVKLDDGTVAEALSLYQVLEPRGGSQVLNRYTNDAPAYVYGAHRKGHIYQAGFLPGLAYIRPALLARNQLESDLGGPQSGDAAAAAPTFGGVVDEAGLLTRSAGPWQYPKAIRDFITHPAAMAQVVLPVKCDTPLVDAVLMESPKGAVVPLANFTLQPLSSIRLDVKTACNVLQVDSVHCGTLEFERGADGRVSFSLPLHTTDFVLLRYTPIAHK